jgi:hypothetical protein
MFLRSGKEEKHSARPHSISPTTKSRPRRQGANVRELRQAAETETRRPEAQILFRSMPRRGAPCTQFRCLRGDPQG